MALSGAIAAQAEIESSQLEVHDEKLELWIHLRVSHAGKEYTIDVAESDRVYDLKVALANLTSVPPERQKILGLFKGKLPPDDVKLETIKFADGKKFTLIGTPQGAEFKDPSELEDLPDVFNDLDVDFTSHPEAAAAYLKDVRNHRKIREVTSKLKVDLMNPLRPGKQLLVLDLDYTILDTKPLTAQALPPRECARPFLHEFLEKVYVHYDICIWSQTSWIWIETKLAELGMVGEDRPYKISFVLDKTSMFTVFSTQKDGTQYKHSVKPLKVIWNHFPQFSAKNTIHLDDLGRNFALNPGEGLKIAAFKNCHTDTAQQDRELPRIGEYLVKLASVPDFRTVDHKNWKSFQNPDQPGQQ